jgi:Na+-translocating ferredoxin:NAD+ oxidoreductase RnfG subunit
MTRLFPAARDYRTVSVAISPEKLAQVEKRVGTAILPGQREQFQYFDMLDSEGKIIGYTQAMTQKGEFGAIELVFGMDLEHRVTGLYIQRSRERDRTFREESFLQRFTGIGIGEADALTDPSAEKGTIATRAVTLGIKKALILFDELVR